MEAMGTDCLLILHGPEDDAAEEEALARGVERIREYDRRFSRFSPESDLSRLNASPQEQVPVGPDLADLLLRSLDYARISDGLFDPVVLDDLLALGYDRTFAEVRPRPHTKALTQEVRYRWHDVLVDPASHLVTRPCGARIDLGGIAKGAAADAAMAEFASYPGALVDLGGDIRVQGQPADSDAWIIAVEDGRAGDGAALDYIRLRDGAVATSSLWKRHWVSDGEIVHHIIDPRSGEPARSNVLQCSVIADTAEHAEAAAKVAFILGPDSLHEGDQVASALGVRGVAWLTPAGSYHSTRGWGQHELDS